MNRKKQVFLISISILTLAMIVAFVLNVVFKISVPYFLSAEWEAGDALNYVGSIFGAFGTIVLGYIAYKQNDRLQELEKSNYIANNSSMILLNKVTVNPKAIIPVNWETEHTEQIISDKDLKEIKTGGFVGYKLNFEASYMSNIPALLHVQNCSIICSDEENKKIRITLFGENPFNTFSRIAIFKDNVIKFNVTFVIDSAKRNQFEETIKESVYNALVEMQFDIMTDKNVITKCKCRLNCKRNNENNIILWEDDEPMVFFYGHQLMKVDDLRIAGHKYDS